MFCGEDLFERCAKKGITVAQYKELFEKQGGRCVICDKVLKVRGRGSSAIDHCHETGMVRGILCGPCNTKVGAIENCNLSRILDYLQSHAAIKPENVRETRREAKRRAADELRITNPELAARREYQNNIVREWRRRKREQDEEGFRERMKNERKAWRDKKKAENKIE